MKVAFLGFGEAGRAFQESLKQHDDALSFCAYDRLLDEEAAASNMRSAMEERGVEVTDLAGLASADWVFSAVTADQSLIALQSLEPHLRQGQLVIDINSVSPGRKKQSAALVEAKNAAYLDMAVMAPVHPKGHQTPVLIAGEPAERMIPALEKLAFGYRKIGDEPGQATAIKMVRSVFVKGLEAITVEALMAAKASNCFDEIAASISKSFPGLGWPEFGAYEFERTLRHGKRRAAEMRESAATVRELGLNGDLVAQIAETQEKMSGSDLSGLEGEDMKTFAEHALKHRLGR